VAIEKGGLDLRDGVGTTGNGLLAALALPDTNSLALDGILTAEGADVASVLGNFHLLHLLTQGGTVSVKSRRQYIVQTPRKLDVESFIISCEVETRSASNRFLGERAQEHTWYHIYP
jgi:hypothetical protein